MVARACPQCGQPLSAVARFCPFCGRPAPPLPEGFEAPPPAPVGPSDPMGPVPWRAVEGFAVFAISLVPAVLIAVLAGLIVEERDALTVIAVLVQEASLFVAVLVWIRLLHRARPRDLGLRDVTRANVGLGVAFGVGGIALSTFVGAVVAIVVQAITGDAIEAPEQVPLGGSPSAWILAVLAVSVIVLAPLAEESFYRGLIFRGFRRRARIWPAALISGGIFAVSHVLPLVLLPIFALGVLLAWVVEWRRSLVPSIVAHMTFNVFGFVFQFLLGSRAL